MDSQLIQLNRDEVEPLAERLAMHIAEAESGRARFIATIQKNRKLMDGDDPPKSKPWEGAPEIVVKLLKTARQSMLSRAMNALLTPSPLVHVEGQGAQSKEMSGDLETFFENQQSELGMVRDEFFRGFQASFDDGVAPFYVTYHQEQRTHWQFQPRTEALLDDAGQLVEPVGAMAAVSSPFPIEYPRLSYIPIENIGTFQVDSANWQQSRGVYLKTTAMGADITANTEYDQGQAARLLAEWSGDVQATQTPDEQKRKVSSGSLPVGERDASPYYLHELYWQLPGRGDYLITMHLKSKIILRAIPNPWWLGTRFFLQGTRPICSASPFSDKFGVLGDSLGDLIADMQQAKTLLVCMMLWGMMRGIDPELLVSAGMNEDDLTMLQKKRGPGKLLPLMDDSYLEKIKPFIPGFSPNQALPLYQAVHAEVERLTGTNDVALGRTLDQQRTAFELNQSLLQGNEIGGLMTDRLSRPIEAYARIGLDMLYQFQGRQAILDQYRDYCPESKYSLSEVLGGRYRVYAAGLKELTSLAARAKVANDTLMAFTGNPVLAALVTADPKRVYALGKQWLTNYAGMRNPEMIIGTEEQLTPPQAAGAPGGPVMPVQPAPVPMPETGAGMPHQQILLPPGVGGMGQ